MPERQVLVTLMLIASAALVAVGSFVDSFKFDFGGAAGAFVFAALVR